jgi:DNA-binding MarR family transcriptional regulator
MMFLYLDLSPIGLEYRYSLFLLTGRREGRDVIKQDIGIEITSYRLFQIKEDLKLTDGNLATQLRSLEQDGYITFFKANEGHKTKTFYKLTDDGKETLEAFTVTLKNILYS